MSTTRQRVVVCAANRSMKTGRIVCGARHWDSVMRGLAVENGKLTPEWAGAEQGFIDQHGQWMTREEAWEVANAAGQIKNAPEWDKKAKKLYSEDLY